MSDEQTKQWICAALDVAGGARVDSSPTQPLPMGVAARNSLWKPRDLHLKIEFLEGTDALHDRVLEAASEWLVDGVKLSFARAEPGEKSHLRIAFDPRGGSWSYVGTDCLGIHPSQPTMNLGWAKLDTPKKDFWSVVIHEFGHALGLLHEHNHPGAKIDWDREAVYRDLQGPPNRWDRATIDSNVFAAFDRSDVITTSFDHVSVMIYTVPGSWTKDGQSFMPSWRLSEGDRATIRKLYG